MDRRKKKKTDPSTEFINLICSLYGDTYDDREEDSRPGGEDWEPGVKALHTSLAAFQKELEEIHDIHLSTAKIRKILITGGCWTTERSREVSQLYERYGSISAVAKELEVTDALVTMYLPYGPEPRSRRHDVQTGFRPEDYRAASHRSVYSLVYRRNREHSEPGSLAWFLHK